MSATRSFKTMLETCGYTNVRIEESKLPKHVYDWARGDDGEMTNEEVDETMPYYRVLSDQGAFGIIVGAYMLLDVKGTGYNALDLGEQDANEEFFLPSLNQPSLVHLRQLLTSKKNRTMIH